MNEIPWKRIEPDPVEIPPRPNPAEQKEYERLDRGKYIYVEDVATNLEKDRVKARKAKAKEDAD